LLEQLTSLPAKTLTTQPVFEDSTANIWRISPVGMIFLGTVGGGRGRGAASPWMWTGNARNQARIGR
jgi:hypothetical protein